MWVLKIQDGAFNRFYFEFEKLEDVTELVNITRNHATDNLSYSIEYAGDEDAEEL